MPIGQALPHLEELRLKLLPGILILVPPKIIIPLFETDWKLCLPIHLKRLHMEGITIDLLLLRILAGGMPHLEYLSAKQIVPLQKQEVQSEACRWKELALNVFPDFNTITAFTTWPPNLRMSSSHSNDEFSPSAIWKFNTPAERGEMELMASAAMRLKRGSLDEDMFASWNDDEDRGIGMFCLTAWPGVDVDGVESFSNIVCGGVINVVAPFAAMLPALELSSWFVTKGVIDEMAQHLPKLRKVKFSNCVFQCNAVWGEVGLLASLEDVIVSVRNGYRNRQSLQLFFSKPDLKLLGRTVKHRLTLTLPYKLKDSLGLTVSVIDDERNRNGLPPMTFK